MKSQVVSIVYLALGFAVYVQSDDARIILFLCHILDGKILGEGRMEYSEAATIYLFNLLWRQNTIMLSARVAGRAKIARRLGRVSGLKRDATLSADLLLYYLAWLPV